MSATFLRASILALLLTAGLASAQKSSPQSASKQGASKQGASKQARPPVTEPPKTCKDQCALMNQMCSDPCKGIKDKPQAKAACEANCQQTANACSGSCREKGRIDAQYMMEHIKPPQAPKGIKVVKGHDDAH